MRNQLVALACAFTGTVSLSTCAEGLEGPYGGAGLGFGQLREGQAVCDTVDRVSGVSVTECNDSALAWRAFGGYQFNPYLAAEIGYDFLGTYDVAVTGAAGAGSLEVKDRAIDVAALARLPLNDQFSLFVKGGAAWYRAQVRGTANGLNVSASDRGWVPMYGLGGTWQPSKLSAFYGVSFRFEWQRFQDVGDPNITGRSNVDTFSISIVVY